MSTLAWSFILVLFSWQLAFGADEKCWDEFDKCTAERIFSPKGNEMLFNCCNKTDGNKNFKDSAFICVVDGMFKLCEDIVADKCSSDESTSSGSSMEDFEKFPEKGDDCNNYPEKMKKYYKDLCKKPEDDDVFCKTLENIA